MSNTVERKIVCRTTSRSNGRQRNWRLFDDGTLEKTNRKSAYKACPSNITPPRKILEAAAALGITILSGKSPQIKDVREGWAVGILSRQLKSN